MDDNIHSIATKLLDFFGLDGKRWTQGALHLSRNHKGEIEDSYCLLGGCKALHLDSSVLAKELPVTIPQFNDTNDWSTVREFLAKWAHPYQPKK